MAGDRKDKNNLNWAKAFDKVTSDQSVQPEGVGWVLFKDLQKLTNAGRIFLLRKNISTEEKYFY